MSCKFKGLISNSWHNLILYFSPAFFILSNPTNSINVISSTKTAKTLNSYMMIYTILALVKKNTLFIIFAFSYFLCFKSRFLPCEGQWQTFWKISYMLAMNIHVQTQEENMKNEKWLFMHGFTRLCYYSAFI